MKVKTEIFTSDLRRLALAVLNTWKNKWDIIVCHHCEQAGNPRVTHDTNCPVRLATEILRGKK